MRKDTRSFALCKDCRIEWFIAVRGLALIALAGLLLGACAETPPNATPSEDRVTGVADTDHSESAGTGSQTSTETVASPLSRPEPTEPPAATLEPYATIEPALQSPLPLPNPVVSRAMEPGLVAPSPGLTLLERALADLAERLGLAVSDPVLVKVYSDEFPSGDLGCASPKEPPSSQLGAVMGQELILAVGEDEYRYRSHGGILRFCGLR